MEKIIRGYWDCNYCKETQIDGLIDKCPGCGAGKPSDIEYYMLGDSPTSIKKEDYLTETELNNAGISIEECDGNHKEWICDYCGWTNNYADTSCSSCGSPKIDHTKEYGDDTNKKEDSNSYKGDIVEEPIPATRISNFIGDTIYNKGKIIFIAILSLLLIGIFGFLLAPIEKEITVVDYSWKSTINIEQEKTVSESDWTLPSEGRLQDTKEEIYNYNPVFSHYETVTVTKSRQVIDRYDISYYYDDNGNGTFTQKQRSTPVYKTEYYTENEQKAVYDQIPVYKTKYYYNIDKWFFDHSIVVEEHNKEPYYSTDYSLAIRQRDIDRFMNYYIYFDDSEKNEVSYDDWLKTEIGDKKILVKNRLGFTYKIK